MPNGLKCIPALLLAISVLAGCELPTDSSSDASNLESIINEQLPGQLSRNLGIEGFVRNVICTETGIGNRLDCLARVEVFDFSSRNGGGVQSIPIVGYCDGSNCTWKTTR